MNEEETPTPQPEKTEPDRAGPVAPETKEPQINRSQLVRECIRRHPEWTYGQIAAWVKQKTGLSITKSTIGRAKQSAGRKEGRPHSKGAGLAEIARRGFDTIQLAEAMSRCVTNTDINLITRKLVEKAQHGDLKATELLFNRLWGKPKEHLTKESTTTTVDMKALTNDELDRLELIMRKTQGTYPALPQGQIVDAEVTSENHDPEEDVPTVD